MSLYYLTSNDFSVTEGQLQCKHARNEFILMFFFSPDCQYCKPIMSLIQQLVRGLQGCKFALINVRENYMISQMSRNTNTPITYVPLLMLYYGGKPYQKFSAAPSLANLQTFILNAANQVKTQFATKPPEKEVPAYTVGIPYCDEDSGVCYLNFDSAYKSAGAAATR
jgi:thioredoxin-like negative regulator of GroEL